MVSMVWKILGVRDVSMGSRAVAIAWGVDGPSGLMYILEFCGEVRAGHHKLRLASTCVHRDLSSQRTPF